MAPRSTRTFSLADLPEVFPTSTAISEALQRAVRAGRARKLTGRLYTQNLEQPLEQIARRNWQPIVAHYFPDSVVVDRSAFEAKLAGDGSLFLDAGPNYARKRPIQLPGLTLRPRKGPGPQPGDMPFMAIYISSRARAMLDNLRPSRAVGGIRRTFSRADLEGELARLMELRGGEALNELRDEARELAPRIDAADEMDVLDDLIGALLGTRSVELQTAAARAHREGMGFDRDRTDLFAALQAELLREPLAGRPAQADSFPALSFFEAYFSNWIEGTEFELEEAEEIVFERRIPPARNEDAHDVLGTFDVVNDAIKRSERAADAEGFLDLLRSRHAQMLGHRPAAEPGAFKQRANRAGATTFVTPELVNGTLRLGYRYLEPLPAGLPRAIFVMFLISEVHPFTDGNGRVGRVFMNAELSAVDQQRIVIPLSYRDNYLSGLRVLSRSANPQPLIRVLDFAQEYAAAIDWSDLRKAEKMMQESNAFLEPDLAEERGVRLRLPSP